ncbi:MAG: hypothetical protein V2I27_03705 [Erythrobacter sp.]|nr:hypothetical protein [Erythrobacter sp.]
MCDSMAQSFVGWNGASVGGDSALVRRAIRQSTAIALQSKSA